MHSLLLDPPNPKLAREVFAEANRAVARYFLRFRTRSNFVLLLAVWHLDFLVRLAFKLRRAIRM